MKYIFLLGLLTGLVAGLFLQEVVPASTNYVRQAVDVYKEKQQEREEKRFEEWQKSTELNQKRVEEI